MISSVKYKVPAVLSRTQTYNNLSKQRQHCQCLIRQSPTINSVRRINTKAILGNNRPPEATSQSITFEEEYHIRSSLEKIIFRFASRPYNKMTLNSLIKFGHTVKNNKLTDAEVIEAANSTLQNLLILNAKRLIHIRSLPYMVVLNPHISLSYSLYLQSMREILSFPPIKTVSDAKDFVGVLEDFLDKHADAIPRLSRGFTEIIGKFYPKDLSMQFLDIHLRERIIMKLTAQHFIFLMRPPHESSVGVLDLNLNINDLVKNQADFVNELCNLKYMKDCQIDIQTNHYYTSTDTNNNKSLLVERNKPIHFPFIYENLEYTITELLKNSFRAHIENDVPYEKKIEIVINKHHEEPDQGDGKVPVLEIRIRDNGGGIDPAIQQQMYDFSFTTVKTQDPEELGDDNDNRSVAGMGYGLGLSRTYCQIFNGSLHVESYWGFGTDVYIKLKGPDLSLIR